MCFSVETSGTLHIINTAVPFSFFFFEENACFFVDEKRVVADAREVERFPGSKLASVWCNSTRVDCYRGFAGQVIGIALRHGGVVFTVSSEWSHNCE